MFVIIKRASMSQDSVMPKIDVNKELSGSAQLNYMRLMEKENMERVRKLKRIRHRNLLTGFLLTGGVLSVYAYSMFAVKQENFLDDLDEPLPK